MRERVEVVIVGAGFSGTRVALELLGRDDGPSSIALIDPAGDAGGLAYGPTARPSHLLNVPVGKMSAFAGDPDHFLRWLRAAGLSASPSEFVPRALFGRYLKDLLGRAEAARPGMLRRIPVRASSIEPGWTVRFSDGHAIGADAVVLALGNLPPAPPALPAERFFSSPAWIGDPWTKGALDGIAPSAPIALLGSGLTAVDAVLALLERGHFGTVHLISRHGLLPRAHAPVRAAAGPIRLPRDLRGAMRTVRAACRHGEWRAVVDSLRPRLADLWRGFSSEDKRRFVRHVRAWWDAHRHRMAPEAAELLASRLRTGRLRAHAGRLVHAEATADGAFVAFRRRGSGTIESIAVARLVNCTGPGDLRSSRDPLLVALLDSGAVSTDALGLGLRTAADGTVLSASGSPQRGLYAIGPLRKGDLWESTAVPEIRVQAASLATALVSRGRTTVADAAPA